MLQFSDLGPPKKVRGYTMKSDTWSMDSNQKIVVTFNHNSRPIGDEGNELTQFMGTLVRMAQNVPIDIPEWRMVPDHKKEDLYSMIKVCIYLIFELQHRGKSVIY